MSSFKYAGTVGYAGKANPRQAKIQGVIVHHTATTRLDVVKRMFSTTAYEVSAHAIATPDGLLEAVPEHLRAWTSGSPADGGKGASWDHQSLTVETLNATPGPSWQIAESTYRHLAAWIAYAAEKYGFEINRTTVVGHKELYERYGASYPTVCPGGIDLDKLVRLAQQYRNPDPLEEIMAMYKDRDQFEDRMRSLIREQVPHAHFKSGEQDAKGKDKRINLAAGIRLIARRVQIALARLARIETKLDTLLKESTK